MSFLTPAAQSSSLEDDSTAFLQICVSYFKWALIGFNFIEDVRFPGITSMLRVDQIRCGCTAYRDTFKKSITTFSYHYRKSLIYYRRRMRANLSHYHFDHVMTKYSDEKLKRCASTNSHTSLTAEPIIPHCSFSGHLMIDSHVADVSGSTPLITVP